MTPIVEQHWFAIKELATALLAKDWQPLKPLKSEDKWSNETTAKYVVGHRTCVVDPIFWTKKDPFLR